jgi:hypothetical protein
MSLGASKAEGQEVDPDWTPLLGPLEPIRIRTAPALDHVRRAALVDGILCRWAFMLMADPAAALAESRRALRPGGTLGLAAIPSVG